MEFHIPIKSKMSRKTKVNTVEDLVSMLLSHLGVEKGIVIGNGRIRRRSIEEL